jgi:uncharacterized protein (DUF1330 family)
MEVTNEIYPSPDRAERTGPLPDGPIVMVNLLKFRDRAKYSDGSDGGISGREAYLLYAAVAAEVTAEGGGRMLFAGDVTHLRLGHVEQLWDEVLLVEYPNQEALAALGTSEVWQTVAHHREAALEGQLNLESVHTAEFGTITEPM